MSNETFNVSVEGRIETTFSLPYRGMQLTLSSENHYSNSSSSPGASSSDSPRSICDVSDRDTSSPPNMMDRCFSQDAPVDNRYNTTLPKDDVFSSESMNMNQTFIATPSNGSVTFWNENLNVVMSSQETGSEKSQSIRSHKEAADSNPPMSPDSTGRNSQQNSSKTCQRDSNENDCCSLSSGEMVMRINSFCLEDQSLLMYSSLEDSSMSPAVGYPSLPSEASLLSTTLPDVCEGLQEQKSVECVIEKRDPPCLGMTFTQADDWELPTEENDVATSSSFVALPNEDEGALLKTFMCQTSTDCERGAQLASNSSVEAVALPDFTGAFTPDKAIVSAASDMQDAVKDTHTSTPVQIMGNHMLSLPSLSESPCTEDTSSPAIHSAKQQQMSATAKQHQSTGLPPSANRVKKMEIKKFPKSDFSGVKSKVVTRLAPHTSVSQHKSSPINMHSKHTQACRRPPMNMTHAKVMNSGTVPSPSAKMVNGAQRGGNTGASSLGRTLIQSSEHDFTAASDSPALPRIHENGEDKSRASLPDHPSAPSEHSSSALCSSTSSKAEPAASSLVATPSAQHAVNQTFCFSPSEKSPARTGHKDVKQTPKKGLSNNAGVKSGSALSHYKPPVLKAHRRCSSESSSASYRPPKEKNPASCSTSFTIRKADTHMAHNKPGIPNVSAQNKPGRQAEATKGSAEKSSRGVRKISLVEESSKSTTGATCDESRSRVGGRPSPKSARGATPSKPQAANAQPASLSVRLRQGTLGREECSTSKAIVTTQPKQRSTTASQRTQAREEPSLGAPSVKGKIKLQGNGSRPPSTPSRPTPMGPVSTPVSRLPRKTQGTSISLEGTGSTQAASGGAAYRPAQLKAVVLKARLITTPGRNIGPALATACKPTASINQGSANSTISPLKRTASSRLSYLTSTGPVDKNKPKASSRQQHPHQQASRPNQCNGPSDLVPAGVIEDYRAECRRKNESLQKLKGLLAASHSRFEGLAIVLQQTLAERDEAKKQCRELSQELVNLRGELVCSVHSSERLEKEKDELRMVLEEALQGLQDQHQRDLVELEQRLQAFYQAEWDKVHLTYQEEADKCKTLMEQQMAELQASHEAMKLELEVRHAEQLQCVKQQYEDSLEELRKVHNQELESLDTSLRDTEASLSGQIEELTVENNALSERLMVEETRRKELAERIQKDAHTHYLEQELESLKVVLDIKNKQLHHQEKKLMEIDKLTEKNAKLDESLRKVQQENEDFRARMERHAALSRQLSTEQAVLHESLQKESKVNKRLSMENEELLWKLHNGDLCSPRKVSPTSTSPSHSFNLPSPRSSALFSSPPVSPR